MKSMKNIILGAFATTALLFSCDHADFDPIPMAEPSAPWQATMTIAAFKDSLNQEKMDGVNKRMFQYHNISDIYDIVLCGRVTSSDVAGNVYKYIVIQDTITGDALKISIDASGISGTYPEGQLVMVKCNNMTYGNYADMVQLGRVNYDSKKGYVVGRMPKVLADAQIIPVGLPDKSKIIVKEMTIEQILQSDASIHGQLVRIKDCHFTMHGADYGKPTDKMLPAEERIFAPSTNGIGYPQSREIVDGSNASIFVSTSEYARFADTPLPGGMGDITALVGFYNDKDETLEEGKIYYQLTLRSLDDLGEGFNKTW